jgi:hypothetical protein
VRVGFLPVDLARWDKARPGDLLAVGLWSDVRPLRGATGLLDWRLCGRLSALIAAGQVAGAADEQTLIPSANRLVWRLVLCAGLGPRAEFSERRFVRAIHRTLVAMRGLKIARLALALPGREGDRIPARRAFQLLMQESEETLPGIVDDLTIIEPAAVQKEMTELLRQRAVKRA